MLVVLCYPHLLILLKVTTDGKSISDVADSAKTGSDMLLTASYPHFVFELVEQLP